MKKAVLFTGVGILALVFLSASGARAEADPASVRALFYHLDPGGTLQIDDLLGRSGGPDFSLMRSRLPSFGFTEAAVWLRIDLGAEADAERMLLFSLRTARLREVDWYLVQHQRLIQHRAEGIDRPPPGDLRGRYPAFLAELSAGEAVSLYVRVRSDSSIWLPLHWAPLSDMLEMEMRWNFLEQAYLGFGFAMVIISILVSLAHPDRGFVHLAGITFFFLGYHLLFHGYLDWWFPGLPAWFHRHLLLVCASASSMFMIFFTQKYFSAIQIGSGWQRLIQTSLWISSGITVAVGLLPFQFAANTALALNLWVYALGLMISGRTLYRYRTRSELCFTLAWLFTILTVAAFGIQIHLPLSGPLHPLNITRLLIPMMYLFFLAANLQRQRSIRTELETGLKARQAAVRANLDALRYQLNPHFLFNSLNAIDGLSRTEPEKVSGVVRKLATFLRLRLKPSKGGLLPLSEEVIICRSYLDIEKMRFEERLQVSWAMEESCETILVPEMILQPLIENAVKFGLKQRGVLKVDVSAHMENDRLCLCVRNTGKLMHTQDEMDGDSSIQGIGLNNLQKRLHYQYGTRADFTLAESMGWVIATVKIPAEKAPHESYSVFNY